MLGEGAVGDAKAPLSSLTGSSGEAKKERRSQTKATGAQERLVSGEEEKKEERW